MISFFPFFHVLIGEMGVLFPLPEIPIITEVIFICILEQIVHNAEWVTQKILLLSALI